MLKHGTQLYPIVAGVLQHLDDTLHIFREVREEFLTNGDEQT
jgi:hypothetical protein